jgi:hypothetical protein
MPRVSPTTHDRSAPQTVRASALADFLGRGQVMDVGIRSLRAPVPHIAGPAFTGACTRADNLMLHAAIYRPALSWPMRTASSWSPETARSKRCARLRPRPRRRTCNRWASGKRHTVRASSGSFLTDRTHPASGRAGRWPR